MIDYLKTVPLFEGLDSKSLRIIAENIRVRNIKKGEVLFSQGSFGEHAYVIKTGSLEVVKTVDDKEILLAVRGKGELIGEIALIEDSPRTATVRAASDSALLVIDKKSFERLLRESFSATKTMIKTTLRRWQKTEGLLRQSEKMAQLGTLSAGITHELNNPASAVQRAAKSLLTELPTYFSLTTKLFGRNLSEEHARVLDGMHAKARQQADQPLELDPLSRSDQEERIEKWLSEKSIDQARFLASRIVNINLDDDELNQLTQNFQGKALSDVAHWLCSAYEVYSLLHELHQGSKRISEIVRALKSYAYLDQAPLQEVDVHTGIEDTLVILKHKLGDGIVVRREFDEELPPIEGYGPELNQVWTNLIDNAIDALSGKGEIVIRTSHDAGALHVEIEDNGPGIPKNIQERIFDPFFTTKEPGKGTGLGLDICYTIVVHKHKGDITFVSKKGNTVFTVTLPLHIQRTSHSTKRLSG